MHACSSDVTLEQRCKEQKHDAKGGGAETAGDTAGGGKGREGERKSEEERERERERVRERERERRGRGNEAA